MAKRVTIEALADWLRDKDDVLLLGHESPDGDAAGSCLAVWHALKSLGKRAVVALPGGIPLLYAGILSSGVAYTFQILGQAKVSPALASLIMSLESVISVLAGWLLLGQSLSLRELAGCVIIFAAILLAQF